METERLFLKPITIADADLILPMYNSPHFIEFIGDKNVKNFEDAENYISEKFLPQLEKSGYGNYVIVTKSDQQKIGAVGIFNRDGLEVQDIGFSFLPEFEGKGYGFEAASKLMETGFTKFGIQKISAITTEDNISSQKLIVKLGLKYLKMVQLPDDKTELMYYEIEK